MAELHPVASADLLSAALDYASQGYRLIPLHSVRAGRCTCGVPECKSPGKHPLTPNGQQDASADQVMVRGWWARWPWANIGLVLGEHGAFALDIDPRNGGDVTIDEVQRKHGPLPDTALQMTGGGGQHFVLWSENAPRFRGRLGPGVDVKVNGYIVVEPSIHASGGRYVWEASADLRKGFAPAQAPHWLERQLLAAEPGSAPGAPAWTVLPDTQAREIRSALTVIDPDDYREWVEIGMALHSTGAGDQAYGLWTEWAQGSPKYRAADQRAKWASFDATRDHALTVRSVFAKAQAKGWANPAAGQGAVIPLPQATGPLFHTYDALVSMLGELTWIVKGMIPGSSIGVGYGPSGAFKSFIMLDAALSIAHGLPWCGRRTLKAPTLYVAGEGGLGLARRIAAWHKARGLRIEGAMFRVCVEPLVMSDPRVLDRVGEELKRLEREFGEPPVLVVLDTLSQLSAVEENEATAMAGFLRLLDAKLRAPFNLSVLIVHHTGHDESRPRGSSAIKGNTDFLFGVMRDGEAPSSTLTFLKQKDGELPPPIPFVLDRQVLGKDADGDELTSLSARFYDNAQAIISASKRARFTGPARILLDCIGPTPRPRQQVRLDFYEKLGNQTSEAKKKAWQRSYRLLMEQGAAMENQSEVWLADPELALAQAGQQPGQQTGQTGT